jgi:hypothetical protein
MDELNDWGSRSSRTCHCRLVITDVSKESRSLILKIEVEMTEIHAFAAPGTTQSKAQSRISEDPEASAVPL